MEARTDAKAAILWPPDAKSQLIGKYHDAVKEWRQEKGMAEDEMVGWHYWLNGHEFEQTLGEASHSKVYILQSLLQGCKRVGHNWVTEKQGKQENQRGWSAATVEFTTISAPTPYLKKWKLLPSLQNEF